jgi:hypothetical protein
MFPPCAPFFAPAETTAASLRPSESASGAGSRRPATDRALVALGFKSVTLQPRPRVQVYYIERR